MIIWNLVEQACLVNFFLIGRISLVRAFQRQASHTKKAMLISVAPLLTSRGTWRSPFDEHFELNLEMEKGANIITVVVWYVSWTSANNLDAAFCTCCNFWAIKKKKSPTQRVLQQSSLEVTGAKTTMARFLLPQEMARLVNLPKKAALSTTSAWDLGSGPGFGRTPELQMCDFWGSASSSQSTFRATQ